MLDGELFGSLFCIDSFEEGADPVQGRGQRRGKAGSGLGMGAELSRSDR